MAFADVAQEADEELVAELVACRDRQFDREFTAAAVKRGDLDPLVEHRSLTGREIARDVGTDLPRAADDDFHWMIPAVEALSGTRFLRSVI